MSDAEASQVVDQELVELRELKKKLLLRTVELKNEYEKWEKAEGSKTLGKTEKDFLPVDNCSEDLLDRNNEVVNSLNKKYISVSSFMLGIKFSDVDKKWISENKYLYTANVKSKVLEFYFEAMVNREDSSKNFEVLEIVCRFIDMRKCYFLEITPCVKRFTEDRDMVNLFSAVSNYTDKNVTRTKILRKFKENNIAYGQEFTDEDGGINVFIHSKNDPNFVYFEIRWTLRFVESLWQIDNCFIIQPVSVGDDFLKENNQLLKNFLKRKIGNTELEQLWDDLCAAIEQDTASEPPTATAKGL